MIDVAAMFGLVALVCLGVGVKLIASGPQGPLVPRPVRVAVGLIAIAAGGYLVWITAFLLTTPII